MRTIYLVLCTGIFFFSFLPLSLFSSSSLSFFLFWSLAPWSKISKLQRPNWFCEECLDDTKVLRRSCKIQSYSLRENVEAPVTAFWFPLSFIKLWFSVCTVPGFVSLMWTLQLCKFQACIMHVLMKNELWVPGKPLVQLCHQSRCASGSTSCHVQCRLVSFQWHLVKESKSAMRCTVKKSKLGLWLIVQNSLKWNLNQESCWQEPGAALIGCCLWSCLCMPRFHLLLLVEVPTPLPKVFSD